ncbi:MAG: hypothetical protein HY319_01205 [Armatimonadetes bacterium]|nr:hypothetical protein [Armatimonadota bacterium]
MVAHYEHDVWGDALSSSSDLSSGFYYRFVGSLGVRFDPLTELHLMRQRWFDGALGRFLSRDPIGFAADLNLYGYVLV